MTGLCGQDAQLPQAVNYCLYNQGSQQDAQDPFSHAEGVWIDVLQYLTFPEQDAEVNQHNKQQHQRDDDQGDVCLVEGY